MLASEVKKNFVKLFIVKTCLEMQNVLKLASKKQNTEKWTQKLSEVWWRKNKPHYSVFFITKTKLNTFYLWSWSRYCQSRLLTYVRNAFIFFRFTVLWIIFIFVWLGVRLRHHAVFIRVTDGNFFLCQSARKRKNRIFVRTGQIRTQWGWRAGWRAFTYFFFSSSFGFERPP